MTNTVRRRLQFSLTALFLVVSGVAVWLGWQVRELHRKQQAVSAIEALGGTVIYDYQWNGLNEWNAKAVPPGSRWLRSVLGDNYQANVVEIQLFTGADQNPQGFTDAEARRVAVLKELKWVVLQDTTLTDDGLAYFQSLTKLERLDIEGSLVTEKGVKKLEAALPKARVFY